MNNDKITTVLVGGAHSGQSIELTAPPARSLIMLNDRGGRDGYTLLTCVEGTESRLFYVCDLLPKHDQRAAISKVWGMGALTDTAPQ